MINSGHLLEDFTPPVNPDKEIPDADDFKPDDWDEREKIPDPDDKKPEDWDDDAPKKVCIFCYNLEESNELTEL